MAHLAPTLFYQYMVTRLLNSGGDFLSVYTANACFPIRYSYSQNGLKFVLETQSIYWIFCVDEKVDLLAVFSIANSDNAGILKFIPKKILKLHFLESLFLREYI
jgi:hypothetical protein